MFPLVPSFPREGCSLGRQSQPDSTLLHHPPGEGGIENRSLYRLLDLAPRVVYMLQTVYILYRFAHANLGPPVKEACS